MSLSRQQRLVAFLVLTYALSSIFYVRIAAEGKLRMLPVLGLMWCPAAAALIVRLVSQGNLRGTGWKWGATRWQILSYLIPPVLGAAVYGIAWLSGIGTFDPAGLTLGKDVGARIPLPAIIVVLAIAGLLQGVIFTLGEEIGWRGFLVPELAQVSSFTKTALITRRGLVCLPLPAHPVRGLQQPRAEVVRAARLHLDDHRLLVRLYLAAPQIGKCLDGGHPARQPQSLHPADLRSADPAGEAHGVCHHGVRRGTRRSRTRFWRLYFWSRRAEVLVARKDATPLADTASEVVPAI